MNPTISNAFSNGDNRRPTHNLASSLSPMQAKLTEMRYGWSLELSPIRAFDALRVWPRLAAAVTAGGGGESACLLYDVDYPDQASLSRQSRQPDRSIGATADRLGITALDRFCDGNQLVMDETSLRELVGMIHTARVRSVLVEGPIEQRDAQAILEAARQGRSPLEVEFRAVAAIQVERDRLATLHAREQEQALLLLAENFRHYLAALRNRPADEFAAPQTWQLKRLMDVSGSLTIRPIETDVFSTAIDVGISTSTEAQTVPADRSLIYDVPSNTWHDED